MRQDYLIAEGLLAPYEEGKPVSLGPDGVPDLSNAYATGIGTWHKVAIAFGYQDFLPGTDETAALNKILSDASASGQRYLTDQDARPPGSASPIAHLWDSGPNAVDELGRVMQIRAAALRRFSENNIPEGAPLATLEEVLVPIYMYHRYQVEAAAKVIGGLRYTYAVHGDRQISAEMLTDPEVFAPAGCRGSW